MTNCSRFSETEEGKKLIEQAWKEHQEKCANKNPFFYNHIHLCHKEIMDRVVDLVYDKGKAEAEKEQYIGSCDDCESDAKFYFCVDCMMKYIGKKVEAERTKMLDEVRDKISRMGIPAEDIDKVIREISKLRGEQKCKCCGSEFSGTYHCSPCVKKHIDDEIKNAQKELMKWFLEESVTDENQNRVIDGYTFAMKEKEVKG